MLPVARVMKNRTRFFREIQKMASRKWRARLEKFGGYDLEGRVIGTVEIELQKYKEKQCNVQ